MNPSENLTPRPPLPIRGATPAAASGTTSTRAADQDRKADVDSAWVARLIGESRALFVLAVAGAANERAAAEQQIPLLARASRNLLFSLLNDLDQRGTLLSAAEQGELAKLQLRVTDKLLSAEPTATEPTAAGNTAISATMREAIDRMRARALWRSGDSIAARKAYQELAARIGSQPTANRDLVPSQIRYRPLPTAPRRPGCRRTTDPLLASDRKPKRHALGNGLSTAFKTLRNSFRAAVIVPDSRLR